ncbi:PTS galactitol transporter subunit IIA [Citrobacter amalonaticus]|uniref:PTS galactitol transporter subunit IIA n=1 Tax=Citrobacter amalonaticus TaxID=35703 RepID=A0A2S4S4E7_CITAM|nr:PTS galactitol transporter subunit IIA [Citrobacter amalonaticus]POT60141.1 PTS galactitol transporter subunit IIA [Citrobacter amalonaticus]POT78344.1 PTS galactitol transporter subunit IIA [Citrobacter amalonaticus]POU68734.1 PTS galactitol transporter subunit IIA [Citrobacter amalonaticus]POV08339.1 PTS galactitol transporter subunit IIA [Citrobacter amalonaticus]
MTHLFIRTGITFADRTAVLTHIGDEMLKMNVVHETYPAALIAREARYPTGIMLDNYAVAIPHCEAIHARSPAIYLIRTETPVYFQQADDDNEVAVSLIIALIVENPTEQLTLLRCLFGKLQQTEVVETLITLPEKELLTYFRDNVLLTDK